MPRLTRLELQGYKSFATKSEFLFGEGVTCIVGPNGSGKSNIADALRWVLGEQSFSALRGRKTEDMIFAGTENRARAGMAAVGVVFDNSDGWLPIDFSEVSIARRAYRDGQNEYLLNGQKTRLRDISDLLATVGLAQRTYTIMGQGLVDAALSLRAEERRSLFEEAAGIGAYRQKRSETLRRLDQTQRNLERAQDIVAEIGPRLRALERQARKTEQHAQIRTDLRALLKVWYGYHWHRLQTRVSEARAHADEQAVVLQTMQTERARAEEALTELRIRITAQRTQRDNQRDELARRQAEYEAVQREAAVSAERLRSLTERRESAREELAEFESRLAEARARDAAAEAEAASRAAERATAAARVRELEAQAAANEREREALTVLIRESQGRASSLAQQISELHARNEALQAEQARRLSEQEGLQSKIAAHATTLDDKQKACDIAHEAAVQAAAERAAIAAEITTVQAQLAALDLELAEAAQAVAAADAIVERQQARLEVLQQEHAALDGAASGRELLQSAVATGRLAGHRGQLIDILEIDPAHRAAIAAALGQALQTLIVDDYIAVDAARAVLAGRGRAVLAPLRAGRKFARPEFEAPPPDMIAFAADLVSCPPAYRDTIELLLGRTVVCRTSAAAHSIAAALPAGGVAVTLDGEAHHADGRVVIGASNESRTLALARELNILPARLDAASAAAAAARTRHEEIARRRAAGRAQIDALTDSHAAAQQAEHAANTARDEAQLALDRERAALEMAQTQLAAAAARLREIAEQLDSAGRQATQLSQAHATAHQEAQMLIGQRADLTSPELAEQLAAERTALAVSDHALEQARLRLAEATAATAREQDTLGERRARISQRQQEAVQLQQAIDSLDEQSQELQRRMEAMRAEQEPLDRRIHELEGQLARRESGEGHSRAALHAAEERHLEARLEYESRRSELELLQRRIEDDFGLVDMEFGADVTGQSPLPLEGQVVRLEPVDELPSDIEPEIDRYRAQMRRMGAINPDAVREHAEVRERHENLTSQIADLEAAAEQMREVIAELDILMETEFRRTFEAVAREFRTVFTELFGGGHAELQLTHPNDLTTTGIDVVVQLPGKREQGLALLSGGERSLTASALIFALLQVSPTPFALLDEVDAMLDEANVGRFREKLRALSQQTQFIIITHNRNTVEVADTVYGISMGDDGVSQMMSLKLDGDEVVKPVAELA